MENITKKNAKIEVEDRGKRQEVLLPEYGEVKIITHQGQVKRIEITDKREF